MRLQPASSVIHLNGSFRTSGRVMALTLCRNEGTIHHANRQRGQCISQALLLSEVSPRTAASLLGRSPAESADAGAIASERCGGRTPSRLALREILRVENLGMRQ